MKYQIIGKNDYMVNPVKTILENRGVQDFDEFLNVNKSHTFPYNALANIEVAVEKLLKHLEEDNQIFIQVDSDCDGYTSSALVVNYIYRISPNAKVTFNVHTKKIHGIKSEDVPEGVKLVIVPDAGSNDYEEHKKLYNRGIDVIVLDHHNCDKYSPYATVVNNQMCDYPNKDLSGAGIAYKFCKAVDGKLELDIADDFLDLVAVGNVADMMDTRSLETRYYILQGLQSEKIKNPFIKAIIDKQSYQLKGKINIKTVGWNISPYINAVIRFGSQEEKCNMFKAMLENCTETLPYRKRGATEEIQQPLAEAMARIATNVKSRQGRARDKGVELLEERIAEKGLDKNKILIVNSTDILDESLTGLVAMQLAQKYKRPTILLKLSEKSKGNNLLFGGSARGYEYGAVRDFRQFVLDTDCFVKAEGHDNAFGFEVDAEGVLKANDVMNELLKDYDFDDIYYVDFVIPHKHLNVNLMKSLEQLEDIWGRGVEKPSVAITDLIVSSNDIELIGKSKDTIKFKVGDIEFIKFKCSEEEYEALIQHNTLKMNVVGECSANEFNGNKTYQIVMNDYEFEKSKSFMF